MKYKSINELNKFAFHDAELEKIEIQGRNMIWTLKNANITVQNSQNNYKNDMCTDKMKITFEEIMIKNFIWLGSILKDSEGNLISKKENTEIEDCKAMNELKKSLKPYCYVFGHKELLKKENYSYLFTMNSEKGVYEFILVFKNVISEWDKYSGKAWYEEKNQNNK